MKINNYRSATPNWEQSEVQPEVISVIPITPITTVLEEQQLPMADICDGILISTNTNLIGPNTPAVNPLSLGDIITWPNQAKDVTPLIIIPATTDDANQAQQLPLINEFSIGAPATTDDVNQAQVEVQQLPPINVLSIDMPPNKGVSVSNESAVINGDTNTNGESACTNANKSEIGAIREVNSNYMATNFFIPNSQEDEEAARFLQQAMDTEPVIKNVNAAIDTNQIDVEDDQAKCILGRRISLSSCTTCSTAQSTSSRTNTDLSEGSEPEEEDLELDQALRTPQLSESSTPSSPIAAIVEDCPNGIRH